MNALMNSQLVLLAVVAGMLFILVVAAGTLIGIMIEAVSISYKLSEFLEIARSREKRRQKEEMNQEKA